MNIMIPLTRTLDEMEHILITLIIGLAGLLLSGAIAGILVIEVTREKSK